MIKSKDTLLLFALTTTIKSIAAAASCGICDDGVAMSNPNKTVPLFDGDGFDDSVDLFPEDPSEWWDFDGDEMNLHIPQSEEARAEAVLLMRVQEQLLSMLGPSYPLNYFSFQQVRYLQEFRLIEQHTYQINI